MGHQQTGGERALPAVIRGMKWQVMGRPTFSLCIVLRFLCSPPLKVLKGIEFGCFLKDVALRQEDLTEDTFHC